MNVLNTLLLQSPAGGNNWSGMLMILAMVVIFYFFMIRPQSKKQKEIKKQREALKAGDRVVTAGGIHGRIREVKENTFLIEVAPNVTVKFDRNSVYPAATEEEARK
ncbi:MAG: preprotein translocase subunit YajC [Bacteroidales bacterium]|nr:preprotein translocase subunit YajC [Bacteroidales bacterium]MDE7465586.1 preprotein translocase subunit YajC [Muribaculaceae bacterium]